MATSLVVRPLAFVDSKAVALSVYHDSFTIPLVASPVALVAVTV